MLPIQRAFFVIVATGLILMALPIGHYTDNSTTRSFETRFPDALWDVYPVNASLSGLLAISWHPSGAYALTGGGATLLKFFANESVQDISNLLPSGFSLRDISFAPNGSVAIICGDSGKMLSYDNVTISDISSDLSTALDLEAVCWSPNGTYAMAVGVGVFLYSQSGSMNMTGNTTGNLSSVSWSPNGTTVLVGGDQGLWSIRVNGWNFTKVFDQYVNALAWNDTSALFSATNLTSGSRTLRSISGNATQEVVGISTNVSCVFWNAAGKWMLGGDGLLSLNGTDLTRVSDVPLGTLAMGPSPACTMMLLAGEGLYVYIYRNHAPFLSMPIPDVTMLEDNETSGRSIIDLSLYFGDDHDNASLSFTVLNVTNASALDISVNGSILQAAQITADWYGSVLLSIDAHDSGYDRVAGTPDDLNFTSNEFNLTVIATNDAPVIDTLDILIAMETNWYYNNYTGHDIDGDALTWMLTTNATWLDMDDGNMSGLPALGQAGPYFVNVTLLDNNNSLAYRNFTLQVGKADLPPRFKTIAPDIIFAEDSSFEIDVSVYCSDPENETLVFYLTGEDTTLFEVTGENSTSTLTFTGKQDRFGSSRATLWVTDESNFCASQMLWINVTPVNDPPVAQTITLLTQYKENLTAVLGTQQATDIDSSSLTYWWFFGDGEGSYGIDLVVKHSYPHPGNYTVELLVSDGEMTDSINLTINIIGLPPNITDDDDDVVVTDDDIVQDDDDNDTAAPRYLYFIVVGVIVLVLVVIAIVLVLLFRGKAKRDEQNKAKREQGIRDEDEQDMDRHLKAAYEARSKPTAEMEPLEKKNMQTGNAPLPAQDTLAAITSQGVGTGVETREGTPDTSGGESDEEEIDAEDMADLEDGLVEDEAGDDTEDEGGENAADDDATLEADEVAETSQAEKGADERSEEEPPSGMATEDEDVVELKPIEIEEDEPEGATEDADTTADDEDEVEYEEDTESEDSDHGSGERTDDEKDGDEAWNTKELEYVDGDDL